MQVEMTRLDRPYNGGGSAGGAVHRATPHCSGRNAVAYDAYVGVDRESGKFVMPRRILFAQFKAPRGARAAARTSTTPAPRIDSDLMIKLSLDVGDKNATAVVRMKAAERLGSICRAANPPGACEDMVFPLLWGSVRKTQSVAAAHALGVIGDVRSLNTLLDMMSKNSIAPVEFYAATRAVSRLKNVGPLLIATLKGNNKGRRMAAAWALEGMKHARAVPALVEALKDRERDVQVVAVWTLGRLKDSRAVVPLVKVLGDRRVGIWVRRGAAGALGRIGDVAALSALVQAVRDPDDDVRFYAARSLGMLCDERALPALKALLNDRIAKVRTAAADALRKIQEKKPPISGRDVF